MKYLPIVAIFLGAILVSVPLAAMASPSFVYTESGFGKQVQVVNNTPNSVFGGNATQVTNGTALFNFVGVGGNDTFDLYGGNASSVFAATGSVFTNNYFNVKTGNPTAVNSSSTFALASGPSSVFNIDQNNYNGSVTFAIISGMNSLINDTSSGLAVAATTFSINVGQNSTVNLASAFEGNATSVNVIY